MTKNLTPKQMISLRQISLVLLGIFVMYFSVTSLVDKRFNEIELNLRAQIAEQEALLTAIAEATSRNGADKITEQIVKDCSIDERNSFDNLLGRLNDNLSKTELTELERLFGRCGSFFSDRKTVMVSRLSREIDIYQNYVEHLSVILGEDVENDFSVDGWQELASEERKQSELFAKLVTLQDKIISSLLSGNSADSSEIREIIQEVNEVQETLVVANAQASNARSRLISL